jgi:uracil-DNA glycosylase family 4
MNLSDIPFIIPPAVKDETSLDEAISKKDLSSADWDTINTGRCTRCELCKSRRNFVPPKIREGCDILFVSDAPDDTEDMWGTEPLIGPSGVKFNEMLQVVGIDRNACSVANAVQCRPPKDRPPSTSEVKACAPLLEEYIRQAKPKV